MDYGELKVKVRGIKYRIDFEGYDTYATNEYGEKKQIYNHITKNPLIIKDRIKYAWKLKPYREKK